MAWRYAPFPIRVTASGASSITFPSSAGLGQGPLKTYCSPPRILIGSQKQAFISMNTESRVTRSRAKCTGEGGRPADQQVFDGHRHCSCDACTSIADFQLALIPVHYHNAELAIGIQSERKPPRTASSLSRGNLGAVHRPALMDRTLDNKLVCCTTRMYSATVPCPWTQV